MLKRLRSARLRKRYLALFPADPVPGWHVDAIAAGLGVSLPDLVLDVLAFCGGGRIGPVRLFSFSIEEPDGVLERTLQWRARVDMPERYVALAEPPESAIVLDTDSGAVVWCAAYELRGLFRGEPPRRGRTYDDFTAFFEALLDDEEQERRAR